MEIPIPILIAMAVAVLAFVGRMAWYLLKGKDAWGHERRTPR